MITATRFEKQLRLTAYRSITALLVRNGLVTQDEAARISQKISAMEEAIILPELEPEAEHERKTTETAAV